MSEASKALSSWVPLLALLAGFTAIVVALAVVGRRTRTSKDVLAWVPLGLEKVTGIPGWAAAQLGTGAFALLVAGIGFYNDVAWHVGLGRDQELFTAPHTMIVVGLGMLVLAAGVGIVSATVQRADTALRFRNLRVPWSSIPLLVLGSCALLGFPLDDLWHAAYGIDVTMWSPTHLLMICGAAFSLIAGWLTLAEAGVEFRRNVWSRVAHVIAAFFVLQGLAAPLGEFRFGVPQFQQLYHPVILLLAAAFTFTAVRLVLGRGWSLVVGALVFVPEVVGVLQLGAAGTDGFVPTRSPGVFLASAVGVELAAAVLGTERRLRFAITSAIGVATIGLAGEWLWNADAIQPWRSPLLVPAVLVGGLAAAGAAVVGTAYGSAISRTDRGFRGAVVAVGALAMLAALILPLPRRAPSGIEAAIDVEPAGPGLVYVRVQLDPPTAAEDALWFQVMAWQGDGFRSAEFAEVAPGRYVADRPMPAEGNWKTVVRLHRGDELLSAAVFLPADPEIGAEGVAAIDRTVELGPEPKILLREQKPGAATVQYLAYAVIAGVAVLWAWAFAMATSRIPARPPLRLDGPTAGPRAGRRPRRERRSALVTG